MPKVISNTSCLIVLSNVGALDILPGLYETLVITPEVAQEFGMPLPEWVHMVPVSDSYKIQMLQSTLDLGEASTIALAMETQNSLMILDDKKARRVAQDLSLQLTGTLGVIAKAYKGGLISNITRLIEGLRDSNFRVPRNFEAIILNHYRGGEFSKKIS
jgi:predicted nucleic acid-binding protein